MKISAYLSACLLAMLCGSAFASPSFDAFALAPLGTDRQEVRHAHEQTLLGTQDQLDVYAGQDENGSAMLVAHYDNQQHLDSQAWFRYGSSEELKAAFQHLADPNTALHAHSVLCKYVEQAGIWQRVNVWQSQPIEGWNVTYTEAPIRVLTVFQRESAILSKLDKKKLALWMASKDGSWWKRWRYGLGSEVDRSDEEPIESACKPDFVRAKQWLTQMSASLNAQQDGNHPLPDGFKVAGLPFDSVAITTRDGKRFWTLRSTTSYQQCDVPHDALITAWGMPSRDTQVPAPVPGRSHVLQWPTDSRGGGLVEMGCDKLENEKAHVKLHGPLESLIP
jgi:hypothetical protein